LTTHDSKESTKVLYILVLDVSDQQASYNCHKRIEGNEDASESQLVRAEGDNEGVDGADNVWWRGQEEGEFVRVALSGENDR
jgi:hypothetical protein